MPTAPPESSAPKCPVVLVILDGWGIGRDEPGNAVLLAKTPVMTRLSAECPRATLRCSGEDVGLPAGQMGNSEVGHLNLGAGFVVNQWITRIDKAIADGSFAANPVLLAAIDGCVERNGVLHLLGLVGDGGVHAHTRHLIPLLQLAKSRGLLHVSVHAFTDGRDTPPNNAERFIGDLEIALSEIGIGRIATISGRYFAMDRDHRWDRTKLAYDAIVEGIGPVAVSATAAVRDAYAAGITDEFVLPTVVDHDGLSAGIAPGDAVIFFNFRSDRGRQLTEALSLPDFSAFPRIGNVANDVPVTTLTRYEEGLPVAVAFPPHDVVTPVAKVVSDAGMTQFHCAETEKYAHVTFFFNGGREEPFPGEERALIASPKVATYDLQPEMSARGVTDAVVAAIDSGRFDFVIVNFANCDMVGHTGVLAAAIEAVETADAALGDVIAAVRRSGGVALVTADHGNAEEMIDRATGLPMTAHTTNPVPVILVAPDDSPLRDATLRQDAVLSAVGTTIIELLGLPVPPDTTTPHLLG